MSTKQQYWGDITTQQQEAFRRLVTHIGFAPRVAFGHGRGSRALERTMLLQETQSAVWAIVPTPNNASAADGTRSYALYVTPVREANGQPRAAKADGRSKWTPARRRTHSTRMKQMWQEIRQRGTTAATK